MKKLIPGTDNCYVTTKGEIINKYGRTLSTHLASGYLQLKLNTLDGRRVSRSVHRSIWEAHRGPIPKGMWINHKDGNKLNNTLSNLEVVTPSENHLHAKNVLKRKYARGERVGMSKLTEDSIEAVWLLLKAKWSQGKIARAFNVSTPCITNIVNKKSWQKHTHNLD